MGVEEGGPRRADQDRLDSAAASNADSSAGLGGAFDVGARLREVRVSRGLSQRELARRAGVTNGMISLIEKNKANPSVASLKKVLDGIPLALADFFALEEPPDQKMFFSWDELLLLTEGKLELRQLGGRRPGQNLQILHERYEPGGDTSQSVAGADDVQAMLSHEGEEGGIVLKGQIELTVDGQTRVLGPGDAYFFKSRLPHRFRNTGNEVCELISACTPPYI